MPNSRILARLPAWKRYSTKSHDGTVSDLSWTLTSPSKSTECTPKSRHCLLSTLQVATGNYRTFRRRSGLHESDAAANGQLTVWRPDAWLSRFQTYFEDLMAAVAGMPTFLWTASSFDQLEVCVEQSIVAANAQVTVWRSDACQQAFMTYCKKLILSVVVMVSAASNIQRVTVPPSIISEPSDITEEVEDSRDTCFGHNNEGFFDRIANSSTLEEDCVGLDYQCADSSSSEDAVANKSGGLQRRNNSSWTSLEDHNPEAEVKVLGSAERAECMMTLEALFSEHHSQTFENIAIVEDGKGTQAEVDTTSPGQNEPTVDSEDEYDDAEIDRYMFPWGCRDTKKAHAHGKGIGVSTEELRRIAEARANLPSVESGAMLAPLLRPEFPDHKHILKMEASMKERSIKRAVEGYSDNEHTLLSLFNDDDLLAGGKHYATLVRMEKQSCEDMDRIGKHQYFFVQLLNFGTRAEDFDYDKHNEEGIEPEEFFSFFQCVQQAKEIFNIVEFDFKYLVELQDGTTMPGDNTRERAFYESLPDDVWRRLFVMYLTHLHCHWSNSIHMKKYRARSLWTKNEAAFKDVEALAKILRDQSGIVDLYRRDVSKEVVWLQNRLELLERFPLNRIDRNDHRFDLGSNEYDWTHVILQDPLNNTDRYGNELGYEPMLAEYWTRKGLGQYWTEDGLDLDQWAADLRSADREGARQSSGLYMSAFDEICLNAFSADWGAPFRPSGTNFGEFYDGTDEFDSNPVPTEEVLVLSTRQGRVSDQLRTIRNDIAGEYVCPELDPIGYQDYLKDQSNELAGHVGVLRYRANLALKAYSLDQVDPHVDDLDARHQQALSQQLIEIRKQRVLEASSKGLYDLSRSLPEAVYECIREKPAQLDRRFLPTPGTP